MTHRGPFQPLLFCDSVILLFFTGKNGLLSSIWREGMRDGKECSPVVGYQLPFPSSPASWRWLSYGSELARGWELQGKGMPFSGADVLGFRPCFANQDDSAPCLWQMLKGKHEFTKKSWHSDTASAGYRDSHLNVNVMWFTYFYPISLYPDQSLALRQ